MTRITPLDAWIRAKAGIDRHSGGADAARELAAYQLDRLNRTIDHARRNSPFYSRHLAFLPQVPLAALTEISRFPFTTAADISDNPLRMLAVRQDDVAKIVTLQTSGSTGKAKRIFFTRSDLELTVDFFHHGMSTLVRPGQKVAVLLPGAMPDSVGDLLFQGLGRMGVDVLVHGPVIDADRAAGAIADFGAHCLVGIPVQVLALSNTPAGKAMGKNCIRSVLLTTDYVPGAISRALALSWGCKVFTHYGMTEMGFGGGVECEALNGYHLREADLYVEMVDPQTGMVCSDGVPGEVVFTTLTREGMPLIRYKTGDIARMIPRPCPCGTMLRTMGYVTGRREGALMLGSGCILTLAELDEALFGIGGLLDYQAIVERRKEGGFDLHIDVCCAAAARVSAVAVEDALSRVGTVRRATTLGLLRTPTVTFAAAKIRKTTGAAKRKLVFRDGPSSAQPSS